MTHMAGIKSFLRQAWPNYMTTGRVVEEFDPKRLILKPFQISLDYTGDYGTVVS